MNSLPARADSDFKQVDLNLGVIGNCSFNALIDRHGRVVWSCMPRPDSEPVFNALLSGKDLGAEDTQGLYDVTMEGEVTARQTYEDNTAILVTRLENTMGAVEIVDFAPRFNRFGRRYRPVAMVRLIRPVSGTPRIRIRVRPTFNYGSEGPVVTHGSNHIRYSGARQTLRLTTDAPLTYVLRESWFKLERPLSLFLGPDESLTAPVTDMTGDYRVATAAYWREWVRTLATPFEWQEAVIRAAITLKLCWFEETGGIIAAMTTSIPEAPHSGRTWDYRYCWMRDAYYVIRALNRLGAVDIMESYLVYLRNLPTVARDEHLQPVYGIGLESQLLESEITALAGYRGMGPVRLGNQAYEHHQHDVYGQIILSATQAFFDSRLLRPMTLDDFHALEVLGERAYALAYVPDAGLWELRTKANIHTYSSMMCWAACDRLQRIASHLRQDERAVIWGQRAGEIQEKILTKAWNPQIGSYASVFGGGELDASLLQMAEVGLIAADDPRFGATVKAIGAALHRQRHVFRYIAPDDFGAPTTAFSICTFWYVDALQRQGNKEHAREIFEHMLSCRNHVGLLSEDIDPDTGELWGNYPQTYALVGMINAATRLSRAWGDML
ncbi:MAG: glycoside hydrolase family 15 protein [Rhodospirillaceae bacterium]|nr:glycoside hydrolase family 15 protein [Rhodospirillaceae bacterium]